jgi:hypothetical protein
MTPTFTRLGVDMIPVVQTKCNITVLLHFEHHKITQRMHDSAGRKTASPGSGVKLAR